MKDRESTEADSCESEKGILSRGLRSANNVSLTFELNLESYSSSGLESGVERDSKRDLISNLKSIIMVIIVAVAKAGFKGRLHVLREVIMRKKGSQFH